MATLDTGAQLTLVELAKRTNNMNLLVIAENLSRKNAILQDAFWVEANQLTSHKITQRQSLPSGTWRQINAGVPSEASQTKQIVEPIGMLESYSKVDATLVKLAPNPQQFRSQEDLAFVEGLGQTLATAIFYGDIDVNPEQFDGLASRYGLLANASVHGAGGTGSDLASLWIIKWGERQDGVHMVYPRGNRMMGVEVSDLGEDTVQDGSGNEYQAFRTHFQLNAGICIRDTRSIARVANIETAGTTNNFLDTSNPTDNIVITALNQFVDLTGAVIYVNRTIKTQMDIQAKDKTNVYYTVENVWGRPTTHFQGIPVRLCEALLDTEDAVA